MNRLARTALLTVAFAWGPLLLTASCSSRGGAIEVADEPTEDAGASIDAAVDTSKPAPDVAALDAPLCPSAPDAGARCTGADPQFVFFPPLACDPKTVSPEASTDGGPCATVTPLDVSFTAQACAAFVDQEAR